MSIVVFDAHELSAWKLQLRNVANNHALSCAQVLSCLESLEGLGCIQDDQPTPPISKCGIEEDLASSPPTSSSRVSTGTQLWTVHPINYSHHVLDKVRRVRQVNRLTRRLGKLAADLHSVGHDFWMLLQTLTVHRYLTAAQTVSDTLQMKILGSAASVTDVAAPQSISALSPVLSTSAYEVLRSLFGVSPAFDSDSLVQWAKVNLPSALATENTGFSTSLDKRMDASVQTTLEISDDSAKEETHPQTFSFLCRRCRQDGRAGYDVDREKMQLIQATAICESGVKRKRVPPHTSKCTLPSVVNRSSHAALADSTGFGHRQRRHLPGL